jgi:hypothetical protein
MKLHIMPFKKCIRKYNFFTEGTTLLEVLAGKKILKFTLEKSDRRM